MPFGGYSKKVWGWMLYDWAAQPYNTLLITFVFAPYFASAVVGDPVVGQSMWGYMTAAVGFSLALLGPIFGAIADNSGPRKPWLVFFGLLYVLGAFALWWAVPNMQTTIWILVAFGIGFLGMEWSQVFVNAMLPDMGARQDLGKISGDGWALGYIGGLVLLFVMLLFFAENEEGVTLLGNPPILGLDAESRQGTRMVGPITAVWFIIFIIPLFLWVPDRPVNRAKGGVAKALGELFTSIKNLPQNSSLASYLVSSMFYRDALIAVYSFGGIYAKGVLGWSIVQIGIFGIVAGISAAVFSYIGGNADRAFGPKTVITWSILALITVTLLVVGTGRDAFFGIPLAEGSVLPDRLFMFCGVVIGGAGGALQAASRTMLVYQADEDRMTEAFGLYALAGRATAFIAPLAIAVVTDITNSQRIGLLPVVILFLIGLCMLFWVKSEKELR